MCDSLPFFDIRAGNTKDTRTTTLRNPIFGVTFDVVACKPEVLLCHVLMIIVGYRLSGLKNPHSLKVSLSQEGP